MTSLVELTTDRRLHVARYARGALEEAGALGKIPTPLDDVAAALDLSRPEDLFDLADVPLGLAARMQRLAGRVVGVFAVRERVVYLDFAQPLPQQRFTHGHEIGHRALRWHDGAYYCDNESTLHPDTHDELEAEANAFSAELLFNLGAFTDQAHASRPGLAPALELADTFGTSRHSAIRRYVEDAPRPCALLILGKYPVHPGGQLSLKVLHGLESDPFRRRYGSIAGCLPETFAVRDWQLARDALTALRSSTITPVLSGELMTTDSRRGTVKLDYELYSNTHRVFVLLIPHRRLMIGRQVRAEWRR
jgi:hypothetical protein